MLAWKGECSRAPRCVSTHVQIFEYLTVDMKFADSSVNRFKCLFIEVGPSYEVTEVEEGTDSLHHLVGNETLDRRKVHLLEHND